MTGNVTAQAVYDLYIIEHANVDDTQSGKVVPNQKILIRGYLIANVTGSAEVVSAKKTIDAKGKLITRDL